MANTVFKLRRSTVAGKVPNTSTLSIGELALNLTDQKLFSSDGSNIFELGSNVTSQYVYSTISVGNSSVNTTINSTSINVKSIIANSSLGTANQVLTSNGTGIYWASPSGSTGAARTYSVTTATSGQNTFSTPSNFVSGSTDVYLNGIHLSNSEYSEISSNTIQLTENAPTGSIVEVSGWVTINTLVAGSNTTIQFNDSGYINSSASFTWDKTSNTLTVGNSSLNTTINSSGITTNTFQIGTSSYFVSNGNVGIGTNTPNTKLDVVGNITSSNTVFAIHFDNVSDLLFKENIQTINNSIQTLSQLNPVSFDWKNTKNKSYGLIAQEVEKILPTIVHQKPDGTKTVNYIEIIAFLIQAIKEQQKQIDDINTHINNAE